MAVTAIGCVSPLGVDCHGTLASLRAAMDCISPVTAFDVSRCESKSAGQTPDEWLASAAGLTPRARHWNRASRMMLLAAAEALTQRPGFAPELTVIGTTSGGMTFGEAFYRSFEAGASRRDAARWVREYAPQQPVLDAAGHFGIDAPVRIFSNACASGTNAIGHAAGLIRSGRARRVLCGGYDALCELVFAGFDALRASTGGKCRPFDRDRSGLVLGEGAAILALESVADARAAGAPILAEITGCGSASDNFHLTQPNPDGSGPRRSMESALRQAGRRADEVDYVNAHGTATTYNDACEARAIAAVCPRAAVSSTKGQMGHALGAAGAIEAVICILALRGGFLPANINHRQPDDDPASAGLDIVVNAIRASRPACVISNSLGFGGANASIVLEQCPA